MDDMIYCQRDIPKDVLRYGFRASAVTGCGWIAAYNALRIMGYKPKKETVKKWFERQIPLFNGNTGTFVLSPAMFFKKFGFSVDIIINRKNFDTAAKNSDACILYYWWRHGFKIGAHFVALYYTDRGFVGYNTYNNSKKEDFYGESLNEFIKKKKYFGTMLIAVKNRKRNV